MVVDVRGPGWRPPVPEMAGIAGARLRVAAPRHSDQPRAPPGARRNADRGRFWRLGGCAGRWSNRAWWVFGSGVTGGWRCCGRGGAHSGGGSTGGRSGQIRLVGGVFAAQQGGMTLRFDKVSDADHRMRIGQVWNFCRKAGGITSPAGVVTSAGVFVLRCPGLQRAAVRTDVR